MQCCVTGSQRLYIRGSMKSSDHENGFAAKVHKTCRMLYYSVGLLRVTHADKRAIRECFFVHCLVHNKWNLPTPTLPSTTWNISFLSVSSVPHHTMPKCRRNCLSLGWGQSPLNSSRLKNQHCHFPLGNPRSPSCSWTSSVLTFTPDI